MFDWFLHSLGSGISFNLVHFCDGINNFPDLPTFTLSQRYFDDTTFVIYYLRFCPSTGKNGSVKTRILVYFMQLTSSSCIQEQFPSKINETSIGIFQEIKSNLCIKSSFVSMRQVHFISEKTKVQTRLCLSKFET